MRLSLVVSDMPCLQDLSGLEGVASVGLDVALMGNGALRSLKGLEGLRSIGHDLIITRNGGLASLDAFKGLEEVGADGGGSILITDNGSLGSVAGLSGGALKPFLGGATVARNGALPAAQAQALAAKAVRQLA